MSDGKSYQMEKKFERSTTTVLNFLIQNIILQEYSEKEKNNDECESNQNKETLLSLS